MTEISHGFLRGFRRNKKGMAATEFALVTPLMLGLYFGITELSDGLMAESKVTVLASTAADLVAQAKEVTDGDMDSIFEALEEIIYPYPPETAQVVISSLVYESDTTVRVDWSDAWNASPRGEDSVVTIPEGLVSEGGSVILAEVSYEYTSPAGELIYTPITMTETFYVRPRRVAQVDRIP
jgi:Flp pilus assembly protein TadG